ncbi:MAG: serine kinase [Pseudomonadota bacterium]
MPAASPASGTYGCILHATTVSRSNRALVIMGPSGSGKSALALQLMAMGAGIIADDRTIVTPTPDGPPLAHCPPELSGRIEARGVGLLQAATAPAAPVVGIVDLSQTETERLPPLRSYELLGCQIPCFHKVATAHFAPALLLYLDGGRSPV